MIRITVNDIYVSRQGRKVIHGLSCTINPGQCTAVVGPNGAGKTTLMQSILGLIPTKHGTVTLDDVPLTKLSRRQIARRMAYLPQQHEGFLGFRVRDLVATGRYVHLPALAPPGPEDYRVVDTALAECGVEDLRDRTVDTLSGGERQKVFLAAAVTQEAPALLLDEPAAALDPRHQAELVTLIRRQVRAGKTVVVVCHDLNLPGMLDARVLALKAGRLVLDAPVEELWHADKLKEIFETDFTVTPPTDKTRPLIGLNAGS